jgi:hypothetical protein
MLCPASTSSVSYRPFPAIHKTHSHLRVPQFERAPSKEKGLGVAIALLGRFTAIHEPAPVIAHPVARATPRLRSQAAPWAETLCRASGSVSPAVRCLDKPRVGGVNENS